MMTLLRSAPQCPRMNPYAERVVRTIRSECTDRMLLVSERHLQRSLEHCLKHYNTGRAHRAPDPKTNALVTADWQFTIPAGPLSSGEACGR